MTIEHEDYDQPEEINQTFELEKDGQIITEESEILSEEEKEARAHGWLPKEEFFGEEKNHMDAATFNRKRKDDLFQTRRELQQTQVDLNKTRQEFEEWKKDLSNKMYKKAENDIEHKRKQAKEDGDIDAMDQLFEEFNQLKNDYNTSEEKVAQETGNANGLTPQQQFTINAWAQKNPWYFENPRMAAYAQAAQTEIAQKNPGISLEENLNQVTKEVQTMFFNKNNNGEEPQHRPVNKTTAGIKRNIIPTSKGNKKTFNDLPPEAQKLCRELQRHGISEENYIKEFFN